MAARSLGVLTLDLVAKTSGFVQGMDKAERASDKWRREVTKNLEHTQGVVKSGLTAIAATLATSATAAAAGVSALTIKGLEAVDSQAKLARSLDSSIDSLSALQLAASDAGLNDLEGSVTRLNRRLGAAEDGTGEAAKAVDELGLSLEELSALDVDERVAAIADAVRDSGVSMQRAARLAQYLGFEQKEAAAFFAQGGDAIRGYRQEIDDLGLAISAIDAIKVEQANDAFARTGRITDAVSQQLAIQVAPIVSAVSSLFVQSAKDAGGLGEATADAFNVVVEATATGLNSLEELDRKFLSSQNAVDVFALNVRIGLLEVAREIVEIPTAAVNEMIMAVNNLPGIDIETLGMSDFGKEIQSVIDSTRGEIATLNDELQEELSKPLPGDRFKRFVYEARKSAEESAAAVLAANNKIGAALGSDGGSGGSEPTDELKAYQQLVRELQTDEEKLTSQLQERLAILDASNVATDKDYMRTAAAAMEGAPEFSGLAPEIGGPFGELNKIDEARSELNDWYAEQLEMLNQFREDRADLKTTWDAQEQALEEEHARKLTEIERARNQAQLAAAESIFGDLTDVTEQFAGEQSDLYKSMFAIQKAAAIAQAIVSINSGIAQAAANPWPVNLAAMASVAAATAGIVSNIQSVALVGMAHDGMDSVPQTGTWLLEKGERVTTAETSAKLDKTLDDVAKNQNGGGDTAPIVNIMEDAARSGTVEAQQDRDGRWVIDVIVADALSDGRAAKTYQRTFGLTRQG